MDRTKKVKMIAVLIQNGYSKADIAQFADLSITKLKTILNEACGTSAAAIYDEGSMTGGYVYADPQGKDYQKVLDTCPAQISRDHWPKIMKGVPDENN